MALSVVSLLNNEQKLQECDPRSSGAGATGDAVKYKGWEQKLLIKIISDHKIQINKRLH
jgi:hypothetical protein